MSKKIQKKVKEYYTVASLIKELKKLPFDYKIVVDDGTGWITELTRIEVENDIKSIGLF